MMQHCAVQCIHIYKYTFIMFILLLGLPLVGHRVSLPKKECSTGQGSFDGVFMQTRKVLT
jgi:hypothetical protein